ncbi:MAG: patatin-like phospholipase family protein [bacterium]
MKIGLALSGGGVLGAAHLGLLEEIEKNNLKIDLIAGTSAGAIVGGLFAAGGTKSINNFLQDLRDFGLFDSAKWLWNLNGDRIFEQVRISLRKNLGVSKFEELKIKFVCNATNLSDGTIKVFDAGDIADAIMASAAYPGVFQPQKISDQYYIDGGITENLPVQVAKDYGADFVIGSSLYNVNKFAKISEEGKLNANRFDIIIRSLDIIQKGLADKDMKKCDFIFNPPVESYKWFHFDRLDEIKKIGQDYSTKRFPLLTNALTTKKSSSLIGRIFGK